MDSGTATPKKLTGLMLASLLSEQVACYIYVLCILSHPASAMTGSKACRGSES